MKTARIILVLFSALLLGACGSAARKTAAQTNSGNFLQLINPLAENIVAQVRLPSANACQTLRKHMIKSMSATDNEWAGMSADMVLCGQQDVSKTLPFRSTYSILGGVLETRAVEEALCQNMHKSMLQGANKNDAASRLTALSSCENSPVF